MSRVLDLNASNYLRPANNAAYQLTSPAMSFACWLKLTSTGSYQSFMGQTSGSWQYRIEGVGNKLDAESSSVSKVGTAALSTGTWTHIAFTSDGSGNWAWYINGATDNSGSGYFWGGQDTTCYVGQNGLGAQPLDGKIAYFAIWSTGLTSGNITTLQTSTTPESVGSGCIGSWHLNTSALTDSSATANDLVVNGTVAFDADNPTAYVSSFSKPMWPMSYF